MLFFILAHILSNIGSTLIKCNVVCPAKLEKFNESNIFQVSEIFPGFWVCFTAAAFDTDTFQHAILDQNEGQIKAISPFRDFMTNFHEMTPQKPDVRKKIKLLNYEHIVYHFEAVIWRFR